MIFELCPTLSRDLLKREFGNTAAAFGVLGLLGFAAGMIFPDMAQQTLQNFAAQVEQRKQENAALEADLSKSDDEEFVKDLARDQLGLAESGERIFYDVNH